MLEAGVVRLGMSFVKEISLQNIEVETDCMGEFQALPRKKVDRSIETFIIQGILVMVLILFVFLLLSIVVIRQLI